MNDFSFDKQAFNERVRNYLGDDQYDKVAEAIRPYIRLRLYEDSFCDEFLAVRPVSESDLIEDTYSDSFYVHANVEQPTEKATVANFRGRPFERYLYGKRFRIPLGRHETPIVRKNKDELMAYDYDLMSDAADKDVYELGIQRDVKFLKVLNECVRLSGKQHDDVTDDSIEGSVQIQKDHISRVQTVLESGTRTGMPSEDQLKATKILMNEDTRKDFGLLDLNQLGDDLTGEVFTDGFTRQRVQGVDYMSSIKKQLLTEHEKVALVQFNGGNAASEDVTIEGETFTLDTVADADAAAETLVSAINSTTPSDNKPGIVEEVDDAELRHVRAELYGTDTVRLSKEVPNNLDNRKFESTTLTYDFSNFSGGTTIKEGVDRFDNLWCFPDPEFVGEIIRLSGRDVESEVWKTRGENEVNRRSWEYFGMGVGNFNGIAKMRMQRERFLG